MKREEKRPRQRSIHQFHGNTWVMPSPAAAKAVYHTLLNRLLDRDPEDWSLVSGFFAGKPFLVFLWELTFDRQMVATVERTAAIAGGAEMEEPAKGTLLTQLLARRHGLQAKEPLETLVSHHPQGKPFWDLED